MQYIPVIVFAIILIIIAFFLKRGKGLWLLAGFNTMSVEERNAYDMEKIGRFISKTLTGMALCLLAFDFGLYINNIIAIKSISMGCFWRYCYIYSCMYK